MKNPLLKNRFNYRGWLISEYKKITTAKHIETQFILFGEGDIRQRVDNYMEKHKETSDDS